MIVTDKPHIEPIFSLKLKKEISDIKGYTCLLSSVTIKPDKDGYVHVGTFMATQLVKYGFLDEKPVDYKTIEKKLNDIYTKNELISGIHP